jgi:DNA-binding beta-propeller fold protein YncE
MLREELGLDPSNDLREFERAILNHDPQLLLARPPRPDSAPPPGEHRVSRRLIALAVAIMIVVTAAIITLVVAKSDGTPITELQPGMLAVVPEGSGVAERTFKVGNLPRAVAIGSNSIWVADLTDQTVTRIGADDTMTTIGLGVAPTGLAAGGGAIWVIASDDGLLIRLEPSTGRVLDRVPLGPGVTDIAVGPAHVWVTNADAGTLTKIDARRREPITTIAGLARPAGVVVSGDEVWVAERLGRRVVRVDERTTAIVDEIPVDLPPGDLVVAGGAIWAVTRVDVRERTTQVVSVGRLPTAVAADGNAVYVLNDLDHSVTQLNGSTGKVVRAISLSDPLTQRPSQITPGGIAADDRGLWLTVQSY